MDVFEYEYIVLYERLIIIILINILNIGIRTTIILCILTTPPLRNTVQYLLLQPVSAHDYILIYTKEDAAFTSVNTLSLSKFTPRGGSRP